MNKQHEIGAGLVEYTPLILFISCILFSLFQILVQRDLNYLLVIGGLILFLVVYVGGFILYDNYQKKNKL